MHSNKSNQMALYKILTKYSDEEHPLSMKDILRYMEMSGHPCSDDSIARYLSQLKDELGIDMVSSRGCNARYFIGTRLLEKEEMRLLVDAVNASNFIEENISKRMVNTLKETLSDYDSKALDRSVLCVNNAKTENKTILYNVDKIQEALAKGVRISFDYMDWNKEKKLIQKNVYRYRMNPWALIWANDRYYLYGYDVKETDGKLKERHYRLDKIANIELSQKPRDGQKQFESFDTHTYVSRRMGMFSGSEEFITVKIPSDLIGPFIDQFGKECIYVKEDSSGKLEVAFKAVASDVLLGWFLGLRNVEVIAPLQVRQKMIELLENNKKMY